MRMGIYLVLLSFGLISSTIGLLSFGKTVLGDLPCYIEYESGEIVNLNEMCSQSESPNDVSLEPISKAEELYFLGDEQFGNGLFDESIESLTAAIALNPHNEHYYLTRAMVYVASGNTEAAKADCEAIKNIYVERGEGSPERLDYIQGYIERI